MPTLKGTEVSLSYVECFLYLVSSSINVSIFSYYVAGYFLDRLYLSIYLSIYLHIHERWRKSGVEREREIYHEELAHVIMQTDKSHDLLSANWRLRKASVIIQSSSKGLSTRGASSVSLHPKVGEDQSVSHLQ